MLLKARGVREVDNHIGEATSNAGTLALDALPKVAEVRGSLVNVPVLVISSSA
jgi:hypothetical protein